MWPFTRSRYKPAHSLTDDEREMGLEVRRMNQEKRRTQHQIEMETLKLELLEVTAEVRELEEETSQGDDDITGLFQNVILKKLLGGGSVLGEATSPEPPTSVSLDDAAIEEIIATVPKAYRKAAQKMNDDTLKKLIRSRFPYDEETLNRIVAVFRAKNL